MPKIGNKRAKQHPPQLGQTHAMDSGFSLRQSLERGGNIEFNKVSFRNSYRIHTYLFYTILGTCQDLGLDFYRDMKFNRGMEESVKGGVTIENIEKKEKVEALIERGKEVFSFFDKCFSEVDEYKFLRDRLDQPWRDDIPLTDRVAIEAVLGQKRLVSFDDLKAGEAAIWNNNVEHGFYAIELSSDGREVEFRLCSKNTGGELINFRIAIKESGYKDVLEVNRAGIQLKAFDPDAIQYPILKLSLAGHKFGEEVFITQEKLKGAGGSIGERVTQTTERIIPVHFPRD